MAEADAGSDEAARPAAGAAPRSSGRAPAGGEQTVFDRDTAVRRSGGEGPVAAYDAAVADGWQAGRGPHGGYLAAMILRALIATVDEPARAPRSLTIHYASAPEPGPVTISTVIERSGRSLSTLSARMEQRGRLVALALAAFSVPWTGPEVDDIPMPSVDPPEPRPAPGSPLSGAPRFTDHLTLQPRMSGVPFGGEGQPMEVGGWIGMSEPRRVDALALAFYADALFPAPFMRLTEPNAAPTIDLTVHFRAGIPPEGRPDPDELCFARIRAGLIQEGFFEEDGIIWGADGTVLAHSRQLALLMPMTPRSTVGS